MGCNGKERSNMKAKNESVEVVEVVELGHCVDITPDTALVVRRFNHVNRKSQHVRPNISGAGSPHSS